MTVTIVLLGQGPELTQGSAQHDHMWIDSWLPGSTEHVVLNMVGLAALSEDTQLCQAAAMW